MTYDAARGTYLRRYVGLTLSALALLTACGAGPDAPAPDSSPTSIDMEAGYTQEEQLREVAIVLTVMQEHFGEVGIAGLSEEASIEEYAEQVRPESCRDGYYRYRINFELERRENDELYDRARAVASQIGLSENRNNSSETDIGTMFFGAGSAEDRTLLINTERGTLTAFYRTRCSDDPSMVNVVEEFDEHHAEELEENAPTHLPGYGE